MLVADTSESHVDSDVGENNTRTFDSISNEARLKIDKLLETPEYYRYALWVLSISEATQYTKEFNEKYWLYPN